jgi:pSer/pThr/pTyr-binding forkhead associated (FHA) protein
MVQFRILSGKQAGATWVARRFPVRVGRAAAADLRLEDDGVWDEHLLLQFRPAVGYVLTAQPEALTRVNGEPVQETVLRNGDSIQAGAAELQFWLAEARQGSLAPREIFTWGLIVAVFAAQAALLYWLAI